MVCCVSLKHLRKLEKGRSKDEMGGLKNSLQQIPTDSDLTCNTIWKASDWQQISRTSSGKLSVMDWPPQSPNQARYKEKRGSSRLDFYTEPLNNIGLDWWQTTHRTVFLTMRVKTLESSNSSVTLQILSSAKFIGHHNLQDDEILFRAPMLVWFNFRSVCLITHTRR